MAKTMVHRVEIDHGTTKLKRDFAAWAEAAVFVKLSGFDLAKNASSFYPTNLIFPRHSIKVVGHLRNLIVEVK